MIGIILKPSTSTGYISQSLPVLPVHGVHIIKEYRKDEFKKNTQRKLWELFLSMSPAHSTETTEPRH
jgi:hypothetical protein